MNNLYLIKKDVKNESEQFKYQNKNTGYTLLDFWKWSASDLIAHENRCLLAEFIVATALNIDTNIARTGWQPYDLKTKEGIKVEVKSSAYLQGWKQKKLSKIIFSIKLTKNWVPTKSKDARINVLSKKAKRHADVYVFGLLKHKDKKTVNPLNLNQWSFYVLSTKDLDKYKRSKVSITLESLNKLATEIGYSDIRKYVLRKAR